MNASSDSNMAQMNGIAASPEQGRAYFALIFTNTYLVVMGDKALVYSFAAQLPFPSKVYPDELSESTISVTTQCCSVSA